MTVSSDLESNEFLSNSLLADIYIFQILFSNGLTQKETDAMPLEIKNTVMKAFRFFTSSGTIWKSKLKVHLDNYLGLHVFMSFLHASHFSVSTRCLLWHSPAKLQIFRLFLVQPLELYTYFIKGKSNVSTLTFRLPLQLEILLVKICMFGDYKAWRHFYLMPHP